MHATHAHVGVAALFGLALLGWANSRDGDLVIYNHSASMPVGLYVRSDGPVSRGAIVTVRARDVAPAAAARHEFHGPRDRFIKTVAAAGGDTVCSTLHEVRVNGRHAAARQATDSGDRQLPYWIGCQRLARDEVLLLGQTQDSFDGHYWGPVHVSTIEGLWLPLAVL